MRTSAALLSLELIQLMDKGIWKFSRIQKIFQCHHISQCRFSNVGRIVGAYNNMSGIDHRRQNTNTQFLLNGMKYIVIVNIIQSIEGWLLLINMIIMPWCQSYELTTTGSTDMIISIGV